MLRRRKRTKAGKNSSLRPVHVFVLLLLLVKTGLSRIKQFDANPALAAGVRRVADVSQSLGLVVLGTALFFIGSMLDAESSPGESPLARPDAGSQ